jgi:translation initiation factor 3 subunit E
MLPMLDFIGTKEIYPKNEILKTKINLLYNTNLIDQLSDCYRELQLKPPEQFENKLNQINELHKSLENKPNKFSTIWKELQEDSVKFSELQSGNLPQYLRDHFQIVPEDIESIYSTAKFYYECGQYDKAKPLLEQYRQINTNYERSLSSLWGILACEIIQTNNWSTAELDIAVIRDQIEDRIPTDPTKQLQYRLWLMHWSLFVFFRLPNGPISLLDLFLGNEKYLRAIEFKAPWILRYVTVAVILSKHRITDLTKFIKQESTNYSDPLIEFIRLLFIKFDFDGAEAELKNCEVVLNNDYIIQHGSEEKNLTQEFLTNARYAICESFCKIHSTIDIAMMAKKLGKSMEESETWIVNLISTSKLDAKIDSAKNTVIVYSQVPSVYQQLLDKTKTLSLRSNLLASNIERGKVQAQREEKIQSEIHFKDL